MVIRTRLVELSTIEAVACRQKLRGGHCGLVILRADCAQPGYALINHRSGEPDPAANLPRDLFPQEAFVEALALTSGLPYANRQPMRAPAAIALDESSEPGIEEQNPADVASEAERRGAQLATVNSPEYQAVVKAYTNRKGELSLELLNKTLIQTAHASSYVADQVARQVPESEICDQLVRAHFGSISGNRDISISEVHRVLDLLNAVSPRSVLSELHHEIQRMLARA